MTIPLSLCPDPGIPVPDYVPAAIAERLAGQEFCYKVPAVVKAALRTPRKIRITEHAEKYRVVTDGPHVGPWRKYHAPHSVKIMDTFSLPYVQEIWYCAPEQAGKTSTLLNCLQWGAHVRPGNIFYQFPDDKAARKGVLGKIKPMIEQSKCLAQEMTGKEKDKTLSQLNLKNGTNIFIAWASNAASMAMFPAWMVLGDEIDKGSELTGGREADRIKLLKKRLRLMRGRGKGFFCSTPAGLFIYKGVYDSPQVWELRPVCPSCGKVELWDESRFVDISTATVNDIEGGVFKVEYICGNCGDIWDEKQREMALRPGRWVCVKGDHLAKPARVGFHQDAFSCIDVSMREIAIKYLLSETGNISDKIDYAHGYRCKNYEYEEADHEIEYILRLIDPGQEWGVCPDNPSAVLLIADTQQVGFWYQVFALGWDADFDVTPIDYGYVKDFEGLVAIQNKTYPSPSGKLYQAESGWIDSGGGLDKDKKKHTRPVQVINFCKDTRFWVNRRPFWHPLKGWGPRELAWDQSKIEFYPSSVGKKVPLPGGMILTRVNSNLWKDELDRRLRIEPGEPGAIRLPVFRAADGKEDHEAAKRYAKQLCAWYRKDNGLWKSVSGRPDHLGDIICYLFAVADMLGVKDRKKPIKNTEKGENKSSIMILSNGVER